MYELAKLAVTSYDDLTQMSLDHSRYEIPLVHLLSSDERPPSLSCLCVWSPLCEFLLLSFEAQGSSSVQQNCCWPVRSLLIKLSMSNPIGAIHPFRAAAVQHGGINITLKG